MNLSIRMRSNDGMIKARAILRLTRWREHVPFTVPLTIAGAMLAAHLQGAELDWRLVAVVVANILAMSFAFMINDVADAPDDALNERKKAHNVISSGVLSASEGKLYSALTFLISLALYALGGTWALIWGGLGLVLSYLYSAYPYRLKARPITDVVSHVLMLSGLLIMVGYFTYDANPGIAWYVIIAAILFSAYGQFYNQVDDYEVDQAAGLKNTVVLLGKTPTMILMYASALGAFVCMVLAILSGAFPGWLGGALVVGILATMLFVWETDMRGNPVSGSGAIQKPLLLIANLVTLMWVVQEIGLMSTF